MDIFKTSVFISLVIFTLIMGWLVSSTSEASFNATWPILMQAEVPTEIKPVEHCIRRWVWDDSEPDFSFWRAPDIDFILGIIDLRSIPQMSRVGGIPQGWGLFVYNNRPIIDSETLTCFGNDIDRVMPKLETADIKVGLSLPSDIKADTLRDVLWELFTQHADPTGEIRWKPLIPLANLQLELHLGGHSLIRSETFDPIKHPFVVQVEQDGYRNVRHQSLDGLMRVGNQVDTQFHRRYLQGLVDKYHLPFEAFIAADLPIETPLAHSTIISEDFNTADQEDLGPNLTWVELNSSDWEVATSAAERIDNAATFAGAYADSSLSTADHYSEIVLLNPSLSGFRLGTLFRKNNTSTLTYYMVYQNLQAQRRSFKRLAGSFTNIGSDTAGAASANDVLRGEANGSVIRRLLNGSEEDSITDTSITGFLFAGIEGRTDGIRGDDFEAADIEVAAAPIERRIIFISKLFHKQLDEILEKLWPEKVETLVKG